MKSILFYLFFILVPFTFFAQQQTLSAIWDVTIDKGGEDKIHDVILTANGYIAMVGETDNDKFKQGLFMLIDPGNGDVLRREELGGNKDDVFFSLTEADEQSFYLVGYSDKGGKLGKQAWVVRLDETGSFISEKYFGEDGDEVFEQIVWTDGHIGTLAGRKSSFGNGNIWFSRIDHQLVLTNETNLGEGVYGKLSGMEKIAGDSVWLCGETRKTGGYSKGDIWVAVVDEKGRERNTVFGSKQIENVYSTNLAINGNLLMAGETNDTPTGVSDALIIEMDRQLKTNIYESFESREPNKASAIFKSYYGKYWACVHPDPVGAPPMLQLVIRKEQMLLDDFPINLDPGENFNAIKILRTAKGRHIISGNISGKNTKRSVRLICLGDVELLASKWAGETLGIAHSKPYLEDDKNNDGLLSLGERGSFKFELLNNGPTDILNLQVVASFNGQVPGVELTGGVRYLHVLPQKGKKLFSFGIKTDANLQDGVYPINVEVLVNGQSVYRFSHEIECRKNVKISGQSEASPVVMRWLSPVSGNSREIDHSSSNDIKIIMMTTIDKNNVRMSDFKVSNNGMLLQDEKSFDGALFGPTEEERGRFDYTFDYTVKGLEKGRNVIKVDLFGKKDSLVINYNVDDPNLYVLAIGVSGGKAYENLNFTVKDATDFAATIGAQKDRGFFNKVFIETLITEQKTDKTTIVSAFEKLYNKYRLGEIQEKDYVMVYYSGHGNKLDNKFYMLPSNFDRESPISTSIDYRAEIRERFLDKMKCKRILFFDACLSGSAKNETLTPDELQQAILRANKIESGMVSIASCTSEELSYESKNNENGIFTEALIEALKGEPVELSSGLHISVSQDNNLVNISELYAFLELRVRDLIQAVDPRKSQKPTLTVDDLDRDLDIFVIKK